MLSDLGILMSTIIAVMILGFVFTDAVTTFHLTMTVIFGATIFCLAIVIKFKGSSGLSNPATGRKMFGSTLSSPMEVVQKVNQELKKYREWETIKVDPTYTQARRVKIANKKTRDFEAHWGIVSQMTKSNLPVLIIYNEVEDVIVDYDPIPPAYRRIDMLEGFDPMKLERLMSRTYGEDKEEDEEEKNANIDFNINDQTKGDDNGGGSWFR